MPGSLAAESTPGPSLRRDSTGLAAGYLRRLAGVLMLVPHDSLRRAVDMLLDARASGARVYVMGNGGSAATASHLVCDLVKTARVPGFQPLRVFALADCGPLMTAWANDLAYERVFAEQVLALVDQDDVLIAISASGNSPNIIAGLNAASDRGAHTIGLLGFDGGEARSLVEVAIHIRCHDYGLVEDTHAAIGHAITAAIRQALEDEQPTPTQDAKEVRSPAVGIPQPRDRNAG
jgi:D-sedoheptulose 7-phosphate isomerase